VRKTPFITIGNVVVVFSDLFEKVFDGTEFCKALKIGFIYFDLSSLEKTVDRFKRFCLAHFKNHR